MIKEKHDNKFSISLVINTLSISPFFLLMALLSQMASAVIQSVRSERRNLRGVLGRGRVGTHLRKHRVANGSDPISARV